MQLLWIFMFFVCHLTAFYTAFSTKIPCILHQNALHLAPKRTAFSGILHCVLQQIAVHLAANSPKMGASDGRFK